MPDVIRTNATIPRRERRGFGSLVRQRLTPLSIALLLAAPLAAQAKVGDRATPITVDALDGSRITLDAKAAGRPMLVEFWATWCEVCAALMPSVREAHRAYGGQVDFYGVNVTVNDPKSRVTRWVASERPPYRSLYDASGLAVRTFQAPVTSYVVIVDADGVIRYTGVGKDQDLLGALSKVASR